MAEINLLQGERRSPSQAMRLHVPTGTGKFLLLMMVGVLVLAGLAWGGVWWWRKTLTDTVAGVQTEIDSLQTELKSQSSRITPAVQAQAVAANFSSLLQKHLYWTQLIRALGQVTLKSVQYTRIQATADTGQFTIQGETPSYTDLGKVMLGLQGSPAFSSVELKAAGPGQGQKSGVKFELVVKMKPSLLQAEQSAASSPKEERQK